MSVVVTMCQKRVAQRFEDAGFVAAEVVRKDQVQRRSCLRLVLIVPVWVVPAAAIRDLLRGQTEQRNFSRPPPAPSRWLLHRACRSSAPRSS